MAERTKHEVDLKAYNTPTDAKGMEYRDGSLGLGLPGDVPIFCKVFRLMRATPDHNPPRVMSKGLVGHTIQLTDPTYGVTIYIRRGMGEDQSLKIMVEDSEGRETVAAYTKEPG